MNIHEIAMEISRRHNEVLEHLCFAMWHHPGEYAVVVFDPPTVLADTKVIVDDPAANTITYSVSGRGAMLTKPGRYAKADTITIYQGTHEQWLDFNAPKSYQDTRCEVCDAMMVAQNRWNAASAAEREEMRRDGYARQGTGPRCVNCSKRTS